MDYDQYIDPELDHTDYMKCGQCWRLKIQSDVAEELKASGEQFNLGQMFKETDKRWRETSLFKEVQSMLRQGINISEVAKTMAEKGIEI